jgi:hypothetical protein
MCSKTNPAARVILLTVVLIPLIVGCAGPRWTGLGDIKTREIAPEHDTLRITSKPSGAQVFVDERFAGITPVSLQLGFRRVKSYRDNSLMDGNKILETRRLEVLTEYIPEFHHIKVYKPGYRISSLKHKGDNREGRYQAHIILQEEYPPQSYLHGKGKVR